MTIFQAFFISTLTITTVKATVLLALTALIAGAARRASAASRHLIWTLGLAGALVLPLLSATLPHWRAAVPAALAPFPKATPVAATVTLSPMPAGEGAPVQTTAPAHPAPASASETPIAAVSKTAPAVPETQAWAAETPRAPAWPWIAGAVWLVGVILVLAPWILAMAAVRRVGSLDVTSGPLADAAAEAMQTMPAPRRAQIRQATDAAAIRVPITWGAWRPVILLPAAAALWPRERVSAALLHEMAHIRRGDWAMLAMARIVCAVYWWNPLAWLAARKMHEAGETACDDLVVLAGMPAADYARQLLEVALAARSRGRMGLGAVAMAQTSNVEGRLRTVLARGLARRPMTGRLAAAAGAAALIVAIPLAALRLETRSAAETRHFFGNGVVQLLGVSYNDANAQTSWERTGKQTWWDGTGSLVARPPVVNDSNITVEKGWRSRHFVFRPVGASLDADFKLVAPGANVTSTWKNGTEQDQIYYGIVATFPDDVKTAVIRVGGASTPWRIVASVSQSAGGSAGASVGSLKAHVTISPPSVSGGETTYNVSDDLRDQDTRLIGLDGQGNVVAGQEISSYQDGEKEERTVLFHQNGAAFKQIQFQTRPYQWMQFSQIPLQPANAAPTAPTPEEQAFTHIAHGELLQTQGQPRDGVAEFRRAVQLDPNNADAQYKLANALYSINTQRTGHTYAAHGTPPMVLREAITHMRQAVRLKPDDSDYRSTLGCYLANDHQDKEAIVQYRSQQQLLKIESMLPIDPRKPSGHSNIAYTVFDNHWSLGDSLVAVGDYKAAAVEYEQALRYRPNSDWIQLGYGKALNGMGRRAEARTAWKKVLQLDHDPNFYYPRLAQGLLDRNP